MDGKPGMTNDAQGRPAASVPPSLQDLVNPTPSVRQQPDQVPHGNHVPQFPPLLVTSQEVGTNPNVLLNPIEMLPMQSTNPQITHILNPPHVVARPPAKPEAAPLTMMAFFTKKRQLAALSGLANGSWKYNKGIKAEDDLPKYKLPERVEFHNKKLSNPPDPAEAANVILGLTSKEAKPQRQKKRGPSYVTLPRYDEWTHIGHGYLVIPDLPRLPDTPTWTDFLFQGFLKAMATGGEGNSSGFIRDDQAPILAASARLEYSMNVDEHGIEQLKVEAKMAKNVAEQGTKNSVEYLAKLRNTLAHRLREYSDDRASIYRPPLEIMEDTPEEARFYAFQESEFHFLTYMVRMIELSSRLMPRHTTVISKALHTFVPLILAAKKLPGLDFHFVGGRLYLNYFHHLFRMLARLSEYFGDIRTIPLRATFGALSTIRADVTCVHAKELMRISDNIDYGGSLSWGLCVLRDISIAVTLNPRAVAMIGDVVQLLTTKGESVEPADLLRLAFAAKERGQLYKFRFFLDENKCFTFRAAKATNEEMRQAAGVVLLIPCPVSPFYQLLANAPDTGIESPDTACVPELTEFLLDVHQAVPVHHHSALPTMCLQFQPRSRATLVSLNPHSP